METTDPTAAARSVTDRLNELEKRQIPSEGLVIGDTRIFRGANGHLYQRTKDGLEVDLSLGGLYGAVILYEEGAFVLFTWYLNFTGAGVTVTENPTGYAKIDIPGIGGAQHHDLAGLGDDDHPQYMTPAEHTAVGDGAPHHAAAHTLASHSTKTHAELSDVTADQHHAQAHTLASHSTKTHAELSDVTADQHHSTYVAHTLGLLIPGVVDAVADVSACVPCDVAYTASNYITEIYARARVAPTTTNLVVTIESYAEATAPGGTKLWSQDVTINAAAYYGKASALTLIAAKDSYFRAIWKSGGGGTAEDVFIEIRGKVASG